MDSLDRKKISSGLRRNRVQFANLSAIIVSTLVPETALLYAPYLFDSPEEADFIYDNYLTPIFTEMLDQKGLKFLLGVKLDSIMLFKIPCFKTG